MVKIFILLANILLPVTAIYLEQRIKVPFGRIFLIFITFHVAFRMWETFFTSKEKNPKKFEGDWTLLIGTFAYIILCFAITFEFFLLPHARHHPIFVAGLLLYFIAVRLRLWGEITLGKQWAVHIIGAEKLRKRRLLRIGPFEFIRHPVYFGILVEELALPLLANTFFSLIMALLVNIPLLLLRLFLEERRSLTKFGASYTNYRQETGIFIPKTRRVVFLKNLLLDFK